MEQKTLQAETKRLLDEMASESKDYKPPMGFGFVKPWLTKTVWLFKAFNQRLNALEKERG
ncbi:hypothetical protein B6A42_02495 [Vibrio coralliilyticus]|uniref:hypothetical protein n=1 Tax=Vibrio coralliilyticus TaxID=190893 RepID=UPI0009C27B82|nr:hypothetical protein [Vibrio coralliilyticus]ARC91244.1 hypothetical protein B6A42_02495 [Vibrio coralliilyticus]MCC2525514.1 hypothetical protein [Vibrio coralliilyticus]